MESSWVTKPLGDMIALQRGHDLPSQNRKNGNIPIMGSSGVTGYHNEAKAPGYGVVVGRSGNSMGVVSCTPVDYWPLNTCLYVTDFKGNDEVYIYYLLKNINFDQFNSGSAQKSLNRNAVYPYEIWVTEDNKEQKKIGEFLADLEHKIELNTQINQTLEQMAQAVFKSWFVDFDPVKAKISAKDAWINLHGVIPATDSPVYADYAQSLCATAMSVISGKTTAQLEAFATQNPEQYQSLKATADLFPDAMQESELRDIPAGWEVKSLGEISEVITKGTTPRKPDILNAPDESNVPFIKVKDILASGSIERSNLELIPTSVHSSYLKRSIVKENDILFSIAGSIGRTAMVDKDLAGSNTNQAVGIIRLSDKNEHLSLVLMSIRSDRVKNDINSKVVQGVQANASLANLKEIAIIVPPSVALSQWNLLTKSLIQEWRNKQMESRNLTQLRDTLLPKLLSGELNVTD